MKKLILALLMLPWVLGASLIDSEDFEGYTIGSSVSVATLASDSNSKWNCTNIPQYPNCRQIFGTGGDTAIVIETSAGNEFLTLKAVNHTVVGNYYEQKISWNHINLSAIGTGNSIYTFKYKLRRNNALTWFNDSTAGETLYALWKPQLNLIMSGTYRSQTGVGGCEYFETGCTTASDFGKMRIAYEGSLTNGFSDTFQNTNHTSSANCTITEDVWYDIQVQEEFNNTDHIRKRIWVDQDLCSDVSFNTNYASSTVPFTVMEFLTSYEFSVSYDDIEVYSGAVSFFECDDDTDNDGDGYTDYPSDPSCTSAIDDSESPYDYVQCNNFIDDDGDGYIDYPNDPSCANQTDTTESPRDDSPAGDDTCLVEEGCILKETFPYTDELNLHGWYGTIGSLSAVNIYGSNKMHFDTDSDTTRFNISNNISNPNIYDSVNSHADFYIDIGGTGILLNDNNYTFYWEHQDSEGRVVNSILFNISRVSSVTVDFVKVLIYNYNGTSYDQIGSTIFPAHDSASRVQFALTLDQVLKTYDLEYQVFGESLVTVSDLPWADVLATKINTINLYDLNSIDDSMVDVYVDDFSIFTDDISYDTVCDTWTLPYYLVETFNGFPIACDWSANLNIFFTGAYKLSNATSYYTQQKQLPVEIKDTNTRYATLDWDAEFDSISATGSTAIRLYDDELFNFLTVYYLDYLHLYYDDDGTGTIAQSSIPLNQSFNYQVILDLQDDSYDIYFNGSKVVSDAGFTDDFYNLETVEYVKVTSAFSDVTLDNLVIYASTDDGTPLLPDEDLVPVVVNETTMCGIIYVQQPTCTEDDDCESGKCLVNNKCARWSANYCTEQGFVYGNKCFLAGTFDCALTGAGNLIVDNFFLFLVLLVLVMLAVYLTIMFRR